jgi:hypothetical protein
MIGETSFISNAARRPDKISMLRVESIDRIHSVVDDLPKYKKKLDELIVMFTVEDMLALMNTIYRDKDFKNLVYYRVYNEYFDEIEDLIHEYV